MADFSLQQWTAGYRYFRSVPGVVHVRWELEEVVSWCCWCVSGAEEVVSWCCCWSVSGAVGGQPDVLSAVDVTSQQHTTADMQRHSSDVDGPSVLLLQNTASLSATVRTVATVESADKLSAADNDVASLPDTAVSVNTSLPHQPVDPSLIPIRYYRLISSITTFLPLFYRVS